MIELYKESRRSMLSDTDPEAAEVQLECLRRMTPQQRFSLFCALQNATWAHAKRGIARANPGATQRELDLIFIRVHYGDELADAVQADLEARDQCEIH